MSAKLAVEPRAAPLTFDSTGRCRVTGTRIPLERIVECHQAGLTPEEIVESFDTLRLADVYLIIAYCLDNPDAVAQYMSDFEEEAQRIQAKIESSQPRRPELKDELLRRKARMETENAEAGN